MTSPTPSATAAPDGPETCLKVWRDRDGRLLRLRLARPKANIVDAAMIGALSRALADSAEDPALTAILLDHEGPHFSFGASVAEHMPDQVAGMLRSLHDLVLALLASPLPVICALRGQCLGGGLELVAAAHRIVAAPDARLGQPEIQLGVFPPAASCLLPERMARGGAEALVLAGQSITGEDAYRLGLVDSLAADPEAAALAWFDDTLGRHSPAVLRLACRAVRLDLVERVRTKLAALETLYLSDLMATRDALEGLTAFQEKRPPVWEGR